MHHDDQKFYKDVFDALAEKVRVVIEWDGYQSGDDEEKKKYYDILVQSEGVSARKFLAAEPWSSDQPLLDAAKKQVKDLLAERARNVVSKMPKQVFERCKTNGYFERLAKQVEMNNKEKLTVLAEDLWWPY